MVLTDAEAIGNSGRYVGKDLTGGLWIGGHKAIIQFRREANLDECSVLWLNRHTTRRLNDFRHARWDASRARRHGGWLNDDGRWNALSRS